MKYKLTLQDVRYCFYGVPKNLYAVYKGENKQIYATIKPDIYKHWYAIQKLIRRYNVYQESPISNTYVILSPKEA